MPATIACSLVGPEKTDRIMSMRMNVRTTSSTNDRQAMPVGRVALRVPFARRAELGSALEGQAW